MPFGFRVRDANAIPCGAAPVLRDEAPARFGRAFRGALVATAGFAALAVSIGDAAAQCASYRVPSAFSIRQSNGFDVTVKIHTISPVKGSANYGYPPKVGQIDTGSFDGRVLTFQIKWSGGVTGRYEGSINRDGKLIGVTRGGGGVARFESIQRFRCG